MGASKENPIYTVTFRTERTTTTTIKTEPKLVKVPETPSGATAGVIAGASAVAAASNAKAIKNSVKTVTRSNTLTFTVGSALQSISFSESNKTLSKSVTINLTNIMWGGKRLTALLNVRDRVTIYAFDGERYDEVWRGYIWTRSYKSDLVGYDLTLKCYDNLIYLQESEESLFFEAGKTTKDVITTICKDWGVTLGSYTYESITHEQLVLRGTLADIFLSDLLTPVKERTGVKYTVHSIRDNIHIKKVGTNSTVYTIKRGAGGTAIQTQSSVTMDGVTTKVVILGKANKDKSVPVEATVTGDTKTYGTLQKLISRDEDTTIEDAKKEAQTIIDENGKPKREYEVTAIDIPWIRKGDKVSVSAGDLYMNYIVAGIDRDISAKAATMTLTLEDV